MSIINDELFESYKKYDIQIEKLSSEKNKFIVNLFNDLYVYLGKIDINKNIDILIFIIHKYINEFNLDFKLLKEYIYNHIFLNITRNYFNKILALYETIQEKDTKLFINNYIMYFMFKIIILLYSYYHYTKYIYFYFDDIKENANEIKKKNNYHLKNIILLSFQDQDHIFDFESENHISKFKISDNDKIYIYESLIKLFALYFFDIKLDNSKLIINDIIKEIDNFERKTPNPGDILLKFIFDYINIFMYMKIEPTVDYFINNYITIPQYLDNCWYISMLTCMTYSDLSKQLLINKIGINNNEKKINLLSETIDNSSKTFIKMIDYLITNITNDHKKYSNIDNDCGYLIYFKHNLMEYIYQKYNELKNNKELDYSHDFYDGKNNSYYKILYDNLKDINYLDDINEKLIIAKKITVCIYISQYLILNTFYNIFNITTLYLYKFNSYYKRQKNIEYKQEQTLKSPDIIFIDILSEDILPKNNLEYFDAKLITKLDIDTIIYNGYKYKLDYIIHHSDDMQTCENSGHVISAIHYNGKQYYYDSGFSQITIKCKDDYIRTPCTLIQHNWINDINSKEEKCLYSIKKCFYKLHDKNSQELNKNIIKEDNKCFNNLYNIICAYIKTERYEEPISSKTRISRTKSIRERNIEDKLISRRSRSPKTPRTGGSNKYISTHKKVNILNKNNKIIERTIYIDKNKYVKLNKTFKPLSLFKYNKKNNYYYI
jgi:hypothetical protein